jgi:hypothetical protein
MSLRAAIAVVLFSMAAALAGAASVNAQFEPPPAVIDSQCSADDVTQVIVTVSEKIRNFSKERQAIQSAYAALRKSIEKCEEIKPWLQYLKPAQNAEQARSQFQEFMAILPVISDGITIRAAGRAIRIGDQPAAIDQISNINERLESVQRKQNTHSQRLDDIVSVIEAGRPTSPVLLALIVSMAMVLSIFAILAAVWVFRVEPLLVTTLDGMSKTVASVHRSIEDVGRRVRDLAVAARQRTSAQPEEPSGPNRQRVETRPPDGGAIVRQHFDSADFEHTLLQDWTAARQTPDAFRRKYRAFAVVHSSAYGNSPALVRAEAGAAADMWAVTAPDGSGTCFVVPVPNLRVAELTVGQNRRAEERYGDYFRIEQGETALESAATGEHSEDGIEITRRGCLRLPA